MRLWLYRQMPRIMSGLILFHLLWFACSAAAGVAPLPSPFEVYRALPQALEAGMARHLGASLARVFAGLGISLGIGLLLGLACGMNRLCNRLLAPLLYFAYPLPKLALVPVIMLFLGIGEACKTSVIVLIVMFPMALAVRDAILAIPEDDYAVARSLGAWWGGITRHIVLPATLPAVISSLRVSVGIAFSALFVTEGLGTTSGLGFYINDAWSRLAYVQMYCGVLVMALSGFALFVLLDAAEQALCPWRNGLFTRQV